jgi:hypothetical protein
MVAVVVVVMVVVVVVMMVEVLAAFCCSHIRNYHCLLLLKHRSLSDRHPHTALVLSVSLLQCFSRRNPGKRSSVNLIWLILRFCLKFYVSMVFVVLFSFVKGLIVQILSEVRRVTERWLAETGQVVVWW